MAIDPYTTTRPFRIIDDETGQEAILDMKIIDYLKYRQMRDLINAIRRIKSRG